MIANLLIRRDRLIAADISSAESDGFVHGLTESPSGEGADGAEQPSA